MPLSSWVPEGMEAACTGTIDGAEADVPISGDEAIGTIGTIGGADDGAAVSADVLGLTSAALAAAALISSGVLVKSPTYSILAVLRSAFRSSSTTLRLRS